MSDLKKLKNSRQFNIFGVVQGSKLFELLRSFSAAQWRRFEAFVQSPYFNKREDLRLFYTYLAPYHPEFKHPRLEKAAVRAHWPAAGGPDDKQLTYLMNQLLALAEQFLAVEALQSDPDESGRLLLEHYRRTGLRKFFNSTLDRLRKKQPAAAHRDAGYYRRRFELAWQEYLAAEDPHRHQFNPALQAVVNRLDIWYLAHKLRFLCEIASQERILAVHYESWLGADLEQVIPESLFDENPDLALYRYAWRITRRDDRADFERFLALLGMHADLLPPNEEKVLYTLALNFCARRINLFNEHDFYNTYLEINEKILDPKLFAPEEELPPWHFLNIVNAGVKTREWDWTLRFIQQWGRRLPPLYTDNLNDYALAYWHYAQQQYGEAQKTLARVEFDDVMLSLMARGLQVRIFFESGETELLFAALEAGRIYLLRNDRIESQRRRQMQQFIDFTRRMAKVYPPDPDKYQKLLDALPPAQEIMHRDWLADQLQGRVRP